MPRIKHVPTHVISGFLGTGKTTAIIELFTHKPAQEKWAVLVNEFGKLGIDQHIYRAQNIEVQEIPGGCMCCAQGVALQVAINRLLKQAQPNRLIIESSGVGHPSGVLKTLLGEGFRQSLHLQASICLIDPMHLLNDKYRQNELFREQIKTADILLGNKSDLASPAAINAFHQLAASFDPPKQHVALTQHGQIRLEWLQLEHRNQSTKFLFHPVTCDLPDAGFQTFSITPDSQAVFRIDALERWLAGLTVIRVKGILNTEKGWLLINNTGHQINLSPLSGDGALQQRNHIEFIAPSLQPNQLEDALQACQVNPESA